MLCGPAATWWFNGLIMPYPIPVTLSSINVLEQPFRELFVNRESERIIKKTAFLTVEDSLPLAAGSLQFSLMRPSSDPGL